MPSPAPPILTVRDLACARGGRLLFENLSFSVPAGGALVLSGPNGSGKSSLLRMLAGLLVPAGGEVIRPPRTGYLGHENALKSERTVAGELGFWGRLDGVAPSAVAAAAERFGVALLMDLPVRLLSAGQKRRVALTRLAAGGAELWLLDEPEAGLDRASMSALAEALGAHRAAGGAVVIASHGAPDLPGAAHLALGHLAIRRETAMLAQGSNS